ncbi:restriction endonuclease subunit S [Empedobacter tilapiae]
MARLVKFGDFLKRSKIPIEISDIETYKRVTIRIKHGGVSLRDSEIGKKIGTKKQFILKQGQFIVSKIDARYGAFGIAPEEVDNAIITGNFWAYDVDFDIIDIDWFNQFTNSQYFYDLCERASSGITHRKYLSETAFLDNEIMLPNLQEQKKSIQHVESLKLNGNNISSEITHQLDLIKDLRQAFLREAMQGVLVSNETQSGATGTDLLAEIQAEKTQLVKEKKIKKPKTLAPITEDEPPFDIPKNWTWCRLGDTLNYEFTLSYGVLVPGNDVVSGVPFVRVQDLDYPYRQPAKCIDIEIEKKFSKTRLKGNELLICVVGSIGKICKVNYLWKDANIARAVCRYMPNKLLNRDFIYYLLLSESIQNYFKSSTKSINPTLNVNLLERTLFPIPPLEIQERIVAKLDELMAVCDALETHVKQNQHTNEQLLQQVLREALGA